MKIEQRLKKIGRNTAAHRKYDDFDFDQYGTIIQYTAVA
jgi:hypothetical protein